MTDQVLNNQKAFEQLLESIENATITQRDKGTRFETLTRDWLMREPIYKNLFTRVDTFKEWSKENPQFTFTSRDIGIDLVATNSDGSGFTAIQCKFYSKDYLASKKDIDSFIAASDRIYFSRRLIVATNAYWTDNVIEELSQLRIPATVITRNVLANSVIDWTEYSKGNIKVLNKRKLREYQVKAVKSVVDGLQKYERGKLVMACGTGKTFTALKIAETFLNNKGLVLFLVPSLSLLSQTLSDWKQQSEKEITAFAVCSDSTTGKNDNEDIDSLTKQDELVYPATTNAKNLYNNISKFMPKAEGLTVVFSTYHSLQVLADAQSKFGMCDFDLIICDEAHRTAGGYFVSEEESIFTKVHDNNFIHSKKRLYMTATPKIYGGDAKDQQSKGDLVLYSMEDKKVFGPLFYNLSFNDAVRLGCLVDYKVIVLAVDETIIGNRYLEAQEEGGLTVPNASKVIGCWKALSKTDLQHDVSLGSDIEKMKRAVGFAQIIGDENKSDDRVSSKQFTKLFKSTVDKYKNHVIEKNKENQNFDVNEFELLNNLICDCKHIDGSMSSVEKENLLSWLREEPIKDHCKILFNVRCLSEGVDVPALDAVMFLTPRKSQIDVVQIVGRVMRLAPGKQRGYVIIPIVVPKGKDPKIFLDNNKDFKVVWQVLRALKSIDQNFGSIVDGQLEKIDKNKLEVGWITNSSFIPKGRNFESEIEEKEQCKGKRRTGKKLKNSSLDVSVQTDLEFDPNYIEDYIETTIVKKIGNRREWEDWAEDVGQICQEQISLIKKAIFEDNNEEIKKKFDQYKNEFRVVLNNRVSDDDVIEMLAQHIVIKPIMDALFKNDEFSEKNPISRAMTQMLNDLDSVGLQKANSSLDGFYDAVKIRMKTINSAPERQTIIVELFEKFFKYAFPKMQEKLGIVYTPIEVVDFIINSVADILEKEFNTSIADKNVDILDPFTGTGTFITRLLQSGRIPIESISYKYNNEIHANEIVPLAYYIACVNIESVYYEMLKQHNISEPYYSNNIVSLTDTFEEHDANFVFKSAFKENNSRVININSKDIKVLCFNPPYSVGQKSANDNNQNEHYEKLEARIAETYLVDSHAKLKGKLFDSYIKAYRWASDRIGDNGVIGVVTNAGWINAKSTDGMRKCFAKEFSSIYLYYLKGGKWKFGETSRKEGESIFGSGSRASIVIAILVKNKNYKGECKIYYNEVDDCLTKAQKLEIIDKNKSILNMQWKELTTDEKGDWLNQRESSFDSFIYLFDKKERSCFNDNIVGVSSNRDSWVYNSSRKKLEENVQRMIFSFNQAVDRVASGESIDSIVEDYKTEIKWSANLKTCLENKKKLVFSKDNIVISNYRPFIKQYLYYARDLVERPSSWSGKFAFDTSNNLVITIAQNLRENSFVALMAKGITDLHFNGDTQCFPRFFKCINKDCALSNSESFISKDSISSEALDYFANAYPGELISSEELFFYIYGILHSKDYLSKYATNLAKELPRIPRVRTFEQFKIFEKAGRALALLHCDYESVPKYQGCTVEILGNNPTFIASKIRWGTVKGKKEAEGKDKTVLYYNKFITIKNIPLSAQKYIICEKSALDWVILKANAKTDKNYGITNDFNDFGVEKHEERYILDLILRVITVSVETIRIVESLPKLEIHEKDL